MAQLIIEIPDLQLPRIIATYKHRIQPGEAVDVNDPTPSEIKAKLEQIAKENIIADVLKYEAQVNTDSFIFNDLGIE